jgi:uncharacterized protein YnzC (UPF0291/DUF896 family)
MATKSVLEKFRDGLSPEIFAQLEESIQTLIDEKANLKAELIAGEEKLRLEELAESFCEQEVKTRLELAEKTLKESYETKTNEFKETAVEKLQALADKYVAEQLTEAVAKETEKLEEKYAEKFENLEESVLDNLDKWLDMEITNKISDEVLKEHAIHQAYAPIVDGIFKLFETSLVGLDTDGEKTIKESEEKTAELTKKLNESYQATINLQKKNDELKTGLLIASKIDGLSNKQKSRVITMFEGKSFDEVASKIDTFVQVLEEAESPFGEENEKPSKSSKKSSKKEEINEDIFAEDTLDTLEEDKKEEKDERSQDEIRLGRVADLLK